MSKHFLKQHLKFNQTLNKTYIQIHCDLVMFRKVINKGIIVLKIIIWVGINRWFYKRKFRFMATQQRKCDHDETLQKNGVLLLQKGLSYRG